MPAGGKTSSGGELFSGRSGGRAGGCAGVLVGLVLAGCVTTSSGPSSPPSSPQDAALYNLQLGISYLRQNNLPAARDKLERALREQPRLAKAEVALGVVFERLEDPVGAEKHYRRAVALDGKDPDNLNALAIFICSQEQQPAAALKLFDRAIAIPMSERTVNRPMLYTNAGTCAKSLDLTRSEEYLRKALALDPQFADALLQMGEVSLMTGNALQARGFLQRYLALGKPTSVALGLGVRIELSLQNPAGARQYLEQLRTDFPEAPETRLLDQSPG